MDNKATLLKLAERFEKLIARKRHVPPAQSDVPSKWDPCVWPSWESLIPPRRMWVGPEDPLVHFFRWCWEYRTYLILLCHMQNDASILELGCNHGRTALGLLDYLTPPGRYEGFDILPEQIKFAQENIHATYPHFNFRVADVYNAVYNPNGQFQAKDFKFPYADDSFNIIYAASLFTHLLPADAANYLQESKRVLRKGGCCLFSFFVLDYYRGKGTSGWEGYEFEHPLPGYDGVAVHDPQQPELVIGYRSDYIREIAANAGFEVDRIIPGYWSKSCDVSLNEQDLVLLRDSSN